MEERLRVEDFKRDLKVAVVGSDPGRWIPVLFPESVPKSQKVDDDEDLDLGDTTGEWIFDEVPPEEAVKTLQEMLAEHGGTLTMEDIPEQGPEDGWVAG